MEPIIRLDGQAWYQLSHESGAKLEVSAHGGHAVSWKTAEGKERLYLSPQAEFSPEAAIRGGVPIIFPQFSDHGPFGRHGFARKTPWEVDAATGSFRLDSSPASRKAWPHEFRLTLSFALESDALEMNLQVANPGEAPFAFHAAFHTYLGVKDVTQCRVSGLEHLSFFDESAGSHREGEPGPLTFEGEVDRAYLGAGDRVAVLEESGEAALTVETGGFEDLVVWNPGPAHGIGDLPTEGWRHFVCIESAQTDRWLSLGPGEKWTGSQRLALSSGS